MKSAIGRKIVFRKGVTVNYEQGYYLLHPVAKLEPHADPGRYCPTCDCTHCSSPGGHAWGENHYCINCGADGAS